MKCELLAEQNLPMMLDFVDDENTKYDGLSNGKPEIFILLDETYRSKGYGTQCVKELLRIAAEDYALSGVHGGCAKENIASARAMEKGGMVQYGTEENGDPLFRFPG